MRIACSLMFLAFTLAAHAQAVSVSIPSLKIAANERIVGLRIHIRSGMIAQLPKVPLGWSLSIDNDPSWNTTIGGNLIVGSAALDSSFFRNFLVVQKDKTPDIPFALSGEVSVTKDWEHFRTIKLEAKDFAFKNPGLPGTSLIPSP